MPTTGSAYAGNGLAVDSGYVSVNTRSAVVSRQQQYYQEEYTRRDGTYPPPAPRMSAGVLRWCKYRSVKTRGCIITATALLSWVYAGRHTVNTVRTRSSARTTPQQLRQ